MRLLRFRPLRSGSLLGFADVAIRCANGAWLEIGDCPVLLSKGGGYWASLPIKPLIDKEGNTARNDDGRQQYAAVVQWADKAVQRRWSDALIALVRAQFPDALAPAIEHAPAAALPLPEGGR